MKFTLTRRTLLGGGLAATAVLMLGGKEKVFTAASTPLMMSGLYAWPYDYKNQQSLLASLSTTTIRVANDGMDSATWTQLQQDKLNAHITISGDDRSKFATEADWIAAYLTKVDSILSQWPFAYMEVWNEPNFGMWSGASASQKQTAYGNLLVATFNHVRTRFPNTKIIGFAAGGSSAAAPGFIKGVLQAVPAAAKSFDVCSYHPYVDPTAPDVVRQEPWGTWSIEGTVNELRAAGITTPIWFTEIGWQISKADGGAFNVDTTKTVSPNLQAAYCLRVQALCARLGIARIHHMYAIDTDNYNAGFFANGALRPQALALRTWQKYLATATAVNAVASGSVRDYTFTTPAGPVRMAWALSGSGSVQAKTTDTLIDMVGNSASGRRNGTTVSVTAEPVFIVGASGSTATTNDTNASTNNDKSNGNNVHAQNPMPAAFVKTGKLERPHVGAILVAPPLTAAAREAQVRTQYRWTTFHAGKTHVRGNNAKLKIKSPWRNSTLMLHITYSAPGYKTRHQTLKYGEIIAG